MIKFSKVAGYMINIQKSILFLNTSNKQSKTKIKTIPLIAASKRIKYLGINLTKEVCKLSFPQKCIPWNVYVENDKTFF